jgi:hypothetical protein
MQQTMESPREHIDDNRLPKRSIQHTLQVWVNVLSGLRIRGGPRCTYLDKKRRIRSGNKSEIELPLKTIQMSIGLWIGQPGFDSPPRQVFFSSTISWPALKPTQPPIRRVSGAISPGVKRPKREADHLPPSSLKVRNGGTTPSLPHVSSWRSA